MCAREAIGAPSMLRLIRGAVALVRMLSTLDLRRKQSGGNGTGPGCFAHARLLKLQKYGRFPDEPAHIKCAQAHSEGGQRF